MTDLDWVRYYVDDAPLAAVLGIRVNKLSTDEADLSLAFKDELSNGDTALHGGVTGSMVVTAAGCVTRAALGQESGPWHTTAVQIAYLSAALGEGVSARARLLRKGKELAHVEVDVASASGKPVAKGLVTARARFGARAPLPAEPGGFGSDVATDPGPMGPFIGSIPFHAALGISAEHMAGGISRIVMPEKHSNAGSEGDVHEGAIMALVDTTGAMSAWAKTGPGRYKASTPGLQARIFDPEPRGDLIGYGRVVHHDRELLFCDVEIRTTGTERLVADGTVNYRIVTPDSVG
ncbi:MAG TPA: PaaI family thioesterase [Acidimicrobiales bacterium]|nr:PaaI family thioesterase [Acidimicrobiales bacterium]